MLDSLAIAVVLVGTDRLSQPAATSHEPPRQIKVVLYMSDAIFNLAGSLANTFAFDALPFGSHAGYVLSNTAYAGRRLVNWRGQRCLRRLQ